MLHVQRFQNLEVAAPPRLRRRSDRIDRVDELRGGPIHDRNFGPVDFDDRIVDVAGPTSAASRCSTVATAAPVESPSTVQSEVCVTLDHLASIRRSRPPGNPVRRMTIPELTSAG